MLLSMLLLLLLGALQLLLLPPVVYPRGTRLLKLQPGL
jgi:hypothetical protein